ncbi:glycosyltransferase [Latilactobacillus sakei]|uniref:glycosyltransferase n=1 Tax=Latilactobacillus sakei TaxID=1599 RepID=UPI000C12647C
MRILHYTLGFPPARSGGLVGYAIDVMNEQINQGNEVYALFPGGLNFINRKMQIKSGSFSNIKTFELINSLPLPIFGGIKTPADFMVPTSKMLFINLLKKIKPDVIHIHTLMGIPKEFFSAAKSEGITIVFTSHDYFGLAPDPSFYYNKKSYDQDNTDAYWCESSKKAYSTKKLRIFQLRCYPLLRKLSKKISSINLKGNSNQIELEKNTEHINTVSEREYGLLRNYYKEIFNLIDKFHFNSTLTKDIYVNNLSILSQKEYQVISITNKDIHIQKEKSLKTKVK